MENMETAQSSCHLCSLWSGQRGNQPGDVMCAVNPMVKPSREALRKARGSLPDAWHHCQDFERAIVPVLGGYTETSNRFHTFEFTD